MSQSCSYPNLLSPAQLSGCDAVLVAVGASVARPAIPGIESERVCTFEEVLRRALKNREYYPKAGKPEPVEVGATVLVGGDHFEAVDAAEKLGVDGKKVYIVTENREFASWLEPCTRDVMIKRFEGGNGEGLPGRTFAHPVTIFPSSTVLSTAANDEATTGLTLVNDIQLNANAAVIANLPTGVRL